MKTKIRRFYWPSDDDGDVHIEGNGLNCLTTLCGFIDTAHDDEPIDVETKPTCHGCLSEWYRLRNLKL